MKIDKIDTTTITAHLEKISQFTTRGGDSIIVIHTDSGNFSNFESVWDRQGIDVESLEAGDALEIAYTTYVDTARGKMHKNFTNVKRI